MGFFSKSFSDISRFGQKLGKSAIKFGNKAAKTASSVGEGISKALPSVEKVAKQVSQVAKAAAPYAGMINPALGKAVGLVGSGADLVASSVKKGRAAEVGIRGGIEAAKKGDLQGAVKKIGDSGQTLGTGLKKDYSAGKALMNRR